MYNQKIIDVLNRKESTSEPQQKKKRVQREGGLQIQCVRWFRLQYPAFAHLLYHAKNEAGHSSKAVAIQAAAGVVPGVPDLVLALPALRDGNMPYLSLGIELKFGKTNNQSPAQREYQRFYEAAGHCYRVIRSLAEFVVCVNAYMTQVPQATKDAVKAVYHSDEETANNKAILNRIIHK